MQLDCERIGWQASGVFAHDGLNPLTVKLGVGHYRHEVDSLLNEMSRQTNITKELTDKIKELRAELAKEHLALTDLTALLAKVLALKTFHF